MKIAFLISSIREVGPVLVVRTLISQLLRAGHQCTTFYFDQAEIEWEGDIRRISFFLPHNFKGFDILHSHGLRPNIYVALYKSFSPGTTRFVSTIHSYIFEEFGYSFGRVGGWLLSQLFVQTLCRHDKIATLSDDAVLYYSRWLPQERLARCYNGVDLNREERLSEEEMQELMAFKGDSWLIGTCSSLVPIKGIDVLLNGFRLLPGNYKLWIIGEGNTPYYQKIIDEMGLSSRVCLAGFRHAAHRYVPYFDIYTQTSKSEGFCLALTEAALYAKKIVTSDIPSMREKYSDEEVAYFDVAVPDDFRRAVESAITNDEMGKNAENKAKTLFSAWKMGQSYLSLYHSLVHDDLV